MSLLTPISEGLGITPGTAGQTVTAVGAAAFITSLLIAPLLPKTDRGRLLLLFTFLTALSNALIAWTDSVAVHFLARALLGFCVGGFTQDGKVDREAAKRLADYLIEHGVHGLFYPKSRLMRPRFN